MKVMRRWSARTVDWWRDGSGLSSRAATALWRWSLIASGPRARLRAGRQASSLATLKPKR